MSAESDRGSNFIEGIFNYCDRWCERCPMTARCLLFYMETKRRSEHVNEDPDDPEVVIKDVLLTLKQTAEMIGKEAASRGTDLSEIVEEERVEIDTSKHPLQTSAKKLSHNIHHFREKLGEVLNEERMKSAGDDNLVILQDAFEVLAWYEFQFFVKIQRALRSAIEMNDEYQLSDQNGSAKVAWIGLTKSLDALTRINDILPWMNHDLLPLVEDVYHVIGLLDQTFSGHKDFRRPGFDD
jgi:hypothetical protein